MAAAGRRVEGSQAAAAAGRRVGGSRGARGEEVLVRAFPGAAAAGELRRCSWFAGRGVLGRAGVGAWWWAGIGAAGAGR